MKLFTSFNFKKHKPILAFGIFAILGILLLILLGPHSRPLQPVSIRLKWINQAQFAGYYVAEDRGYFKDLGLSMTLDPAGPNISPIQTVVSGANTFGIIGADQLLIARSEGIPVVAVAVIYRQTPESFVSLASKNIKSPQDLIGKRVAVIYGNDWGIYQSFLKNNNLKESDFHEVAAIPGISQILSNKVDAIEAYEMSDAAMLKLAGYKINLMRFSDYGVNFYADTLFTTESTVKNNPELVKKVVQASINGWKGVISNPSEAINDTIRANPALNRAQQAIYLQMSIPYITKGNHIGYSDTSTWEDMQNALYEEGLIKTKINVQNVFTNRFLPQ